MLKVGLVVRDPQDRRREYELLYELGQGGYAQAVWAARERSRGRRLRDVALKFLVSGADQEETERFENEARFAANLPAHIPAVVDCKGEGVVEVAGDELRFNAYELVPSARALDLLEEADRAGDGVVALAAARDLAAAVAAIHEAGVVHRDLKPGNAVLGSRGRVRLLDFGLARNLDEAEDSPLATVAGVTTRAGGPMRAGTPGWAPPEQWEGEAAAPSMDVFPLGVWLFQLLTGRLPFSGRRGFSRQVAALTWPAERSWVGELLDEAGELEVLELLTMGCLAMDPRDRPTAEVVHEQLAALAPSALRRPSVEPVFTAPEWIVGGTELHPAALAAFCAHLESEVVAELLLGDFDRCGDPQEELVQALIDQDVDVTAGLGALDDHDLRQAASGLLADEPWYDPAWPRWVLERVVLAALAGPRTSMSWGELPEPRREDLELPVDAESLPASVAVGLLPATTLQVLVEDHTPLEEDAPYAAQVSAALAWLEHGEILVAGSVCGERDLDWQLVPEGRRRHATGSLKVHHLRDLLEDRGEASTEGERWDRLHARVCDLDADLADLIDALDRDGRRRLAGRLGVAAPWGDLPKACIAALEPWTGPGWSEVPRPWREAFFERCDEPDLRRVARVDGLDATGSVADLREVLTSELEGRVGHTLALLSRGGCERAAQGLLDVDRASWRGLRWYLLRWLSA